MGTASAVIFSVPWGAKLRSTRKVKSAQVACNHVYLHENLIALLILAWEKY